jgi:hypothetical protein
MMPGRIAFGCRAELGRHGAREARMPAFDAAYAAVRRHIFPPIDRCSCSAVALRDQPPACAAHAKCR